jgi:carbonic anhydrase
MNTFVVSAMLAAGAAASGGVFDYTKNGADWEEGPEWVCATGKLQSPINFNRQVEQDRGVLRAIPFGYTNENTLNIELAART